MQVADPGAITRIFGGPEAGKAEILTHWAAAARYPDGERIAVDLMRSRPFPYPHSLPGLRACKAAELLGGPDAHWDMFDRIQQAHAVEARNIFANGRRLTGAVPEERYARALDAVLAGQARPGA